eukprot:4419525-Amphidinium_carterae.2
MLLLGIVCGYCRVGTGSEGKLLRGMSPHVRRAVGQPTQITRRMFHAGLHPVCGWAHYRLRLWSTLYGGQCRPEKALYSRSNSH